MSGVPRVNDDGLRMQAAELPEREQLSVEAIGMRTACVAIGGILLISGLVLASVFYPSLGYRSIFVLAGGMLLSSITYLLWQCTKDSLNAEAVTSNPPQTMAQLRGAACSADIRGVALVNFSFIQADEQRAAARGKVWAYLQDPASTPMTVREERAMGIMLGMACGDAVGAPYEFLNFNPQGYTQGEKKNRFKLEHGQWTDDTSMGLCLADVLIDNKQLDEKQLMWAFRDWWEHGYNNAFTQGDARHSVGLGGNISESFDIFKGDRGEKGAFTTPAGTLTTSGNGSLMRLGPVAIVANSEEEARRLAWRQSKVTHKGDEAAGCCELMAYLLYHALHTPEMDAKKRKEIFFDKLASFTCKISSINGLAKSLNQVASASGGEAENWDWRSPGFSFNSTRLQAQPDYIGSYAMDALAMALHCVYTTDSFEEAILKAATRGGDADTVGDIAGQMAGAIYGVQGIPSDWKAAVHQWDRGGEIATRGYLLSQ